MIEIDRINKILVIGAMKLSTKQVLDNFRALFRNRACPIKLNRDKNRKIYYAAWCRTDSGCYVPEQKFCSMDDALEKCTGVVTWPHGPGYYDDGTPIPEQPQKSPPSAE